MTFLDIMRKNKKEATRRWVEAVFATYPLETTGFLRTASDPFANPVAHMTREAANIIFDAIAGEDIEPDKVKQAIERFVKLRAVQKFSPGQSMAVFYLMKPVMRDLVLTEAVSSGLIAQFLEAESRLDTIALLGFDIYAKARETVAESRIKEIRSQHAQLKRWAQQLENGPRDLDHDQTPKS